VVHSVVVAARRAAISPAERRVMSPSERQSTRSIIHGAISNAAPDRGSFAKADPPAIRCALILIRERPAALGWDAPAEIPPSPKAGSALRRGEVEVGDRRRDGGAGAWIEDG
jgi:hypothetical protein